MHRSKSVLDGKLTTGVRKRMKALKKRRVCFDPDFQVPQSPVKLSVICLEIPTQNESPITGSSKAMDR